METEERSALLYESCQKLSPITPYYARLPIEEGFDWNRRLSGMPFTNLYLVVFRSVRRHTADSELLERYDDLAYEEAVESGGLLQYFKGLLDEQRRCLSFCLWESQKHARDAAGGASHQMAAEVSRDMYEIYELERYELSSKGGVIEFRPAKAH